MFNSSVHIKVHVPEIHKKHTHVKTIYRHHYYPKKTEFHHHHQVKKKKKQNTWHTSHIEPDHSYEKGHNYDLSWYSRSKNSKPKVTHDWSNKHDWTSSNDHDFGNHNWDNEDFSSEDFTGGFGSDNHDDSYLGGSSVYKVSKPLSHLHTSFQGQSGYVVDPEEDAETHQWPIIMPSELKGYSTLPDGMEPESYESVRFAPERQQLSFSKKLRALNLHDQMMPVSSYKFSLKPRVVARKSIVI